MPQNQQPPPAQAADIPAPALDGTLVPTVASEDGPTGVIESPVTATAVRVVVEVKSTIFPSPKSTLTTAVGVCTTILVLAVVPDVLPCVELALELPPAADDEAPCWLLASEADCANTAGGGPAPLASFACPVAGLRYQFAGGSPRQSPTVTRS